MTAVQEWDTGLFYALNIYFTYSKYEVHKAIKFYDLFLSKWNNTLLGKSHDFFFESGVN